MEFNLNYEKILIEEIDNICYHELKHKIYQKVASLSVMYYPTPEPILFKDVDLTKMKPLQIGESWGGLFDCAWFCLKGKIPTSASKVPLYLHLDLSGEALLFTKEGLPCKGFTNGSSTFDRNHGEPGKLYYQINDFIASDGSIELYLDAGCNDLFGSLQDNGRLLVCEIATKDELIEKLYYNNECLISYLKVASKSSPYYQEYLQTLEKVKNHLLYQTANWLNDSLKLTDELINAKKTNSNPLIINVMGHSHLDLAWLWPLRESKRKAVRTFTNAFYLLEKNPQMVFVVSQPQQLIWVEEAYPAIFEKIKEYVKLGRIELVGGMYIESDTNIVGEESLARQFYYGMNYYQDKFSVRVKNLWLPDVFGYTGSLPEIMKAADIDYFLTIKISWNLVNKFPHHTMVWKGLDGSEVLVHMPPEGNYNSAILPRITNQIAKNYHQVDQLAEVVALYGIGDGGGGPGDEHLERIRRESNLADLPAVRHSRADEFFEKLPVNKEKFPIWQGELYLENHQGTYTSQSNVKKWNRYLENKLKALENYLVIKDSYSQYVEELDEIWKEILLYHFHDIIPGTCIKRVYDEALARYVIINDQIDNIIKKLNATYQKVSEADDLIYNHQLFPVSLYEKIDNCYVYKKIAGMSTKLLESKTYLETASNTNKTQQFATKDYQLTFDEQTGMLSSIIVKANNKELLLRPSNRLQVYQDKGDAWNILDHYRNQDEIFLKKVASKVKYYGDITEIINDYQFNASTVQEVVIINKLTNLVIFKHQVNWQNVGYMLRTNFDVDVKNDFATYDIQYGYLNRTTKEDDSISKAQFEVCAHNWVNLKDENHSITLLNNAKYGHRIKGQRMEINLLRSTNYPCVSGDIGLTNYQYALLLDNNTLDYTQIDNLGLTLNGCYLHFKKEVIEDAFLKIDQPNIEYSALKGSTSGALIIRLYEKQGLNSKVTLTLNKKYQKAYLSNILEEENSEIILQDGSIINLEFKPFSIITLKIK